MHLVAVTGPAVDVVVLSSQAASFWLEGIGDGERVLVISPGDVVPGAWGDDVQEVAACWSRLWASGGGGGLAAWRTIRARTIEGVPGLGLYRLASAELAALAPPGDPVAVADRLTNALLRLAGWRHLERRGVIVHACGAIREGRAVIFPGRSGAGKSTVAGFSRDLGIEVLHDDRVLVRATEAGSFVAGRYWTPSASYPVAALVHLRQARSDRVVRLGAGESARRVWEDFLIDAVRPVFAGEALARAFALVAELARAVPSYELEFRRSPELWDVVDAAIAG